jgi:hypothetical protein
MKNIYLSCLLLFSISINAQTDTDAIMMPKNIFCVGTVYQYSSWNHYWEGVFKRDNLNLGTVSTQGVTVMGNYGITDKVNLLVSIPYLETKATAGTMQGQKGIQDLSLAVKYIPISRSIGKASYSILVLGGFSIPVSNYTADYLPLSIGLQSKTATLRLMGDIQVQHFFGSISSSYSKRATITIDRNAYLTSEILYTNKVDMPDAINLNVRVGYRSTRLIAELVIDNWVSQSGGFDITKNNMPFPSNSMNALKIGIHTKYTFKQIPELAIVSGYNSTAAGRNIGQTNSVYAGLFYAVNFKKEKN